MVVLESPRWMGNEDWIEILWTRWWRRRGSVKKRTSFSRDHSLQLNDSYLHSAQWHRKKWWSMKWKKENDVRNASLEKHFIEDTSLEKAFLPFFASSFPPLIIVLYCSSLVFSFLNPSCFIVNSISFVRTSMPFLLFYFRFLSSSICFHPFLHSRLYFTSNSSCISLSSRCSLFFSSLPAFFISSVERWQWFLR